MADLDILLWEQPPSPVKFDAPLTVTLGHTLLLKEDYYKTTIITLRDIHMRYKAKSDLEKLNFRSVSE